MCILVLGGLLLLENTIVFVFFAFIRSPKLSLSLLTWSTIFWRSSSVSASNTVSSAYRKLLIFLPPIFTPGSSSISRKIGHLFLPRRPEKTRKDPKRRTYLYREDPKRRTYLYREDPKRRTYLYREDPKRRTYLYREDPKRPEKTPEKTRKDTRKDPKRHPKRPKKTRKDIFIVDVSEWKMTRVMLIVFEL